MKDNPKNRDVEEKDLFRRLDSSPHETLECLARLLAKEDLEETLREYGLAASEDFKRMLGCLKVMKLGFRLGYEGLSRNQQAMIASLSVTSYFDETREDTQICGHIFRPHDESVIKECGFELALAGSGAAEVGSRKAALQKLQGEDFVPCLFITRNEPYIGRVVERSDTMRCMIDDAVELFVSKKDGYLHKMGYRTILHMGDRIVTYKDIKPKESEWSTN